MDEKIVEILESILGKPREEILQLNNTGKNYWNSLQLIELVFSLEQEFNIQIKNEDVQKIKSIQAIREVLGSYGLK